MKYTLERIEGIVWCCFALLLLMLVKLYDMSMLLYFSVVSYVYGALLVLHSVIASYREKSKIVKKF
jgi:hypothetical protein